MASSILEFWNTLGRPVQIVCVLLSLMSVISIAVVIERRLGLWMSARDSQRFVPLALAAFQSGILGEILPLAHQCRMSPEAEMVRLSGLEEGEDPDAEWKANRRLILARWRVERYLTRLNIELRQGLSILGTIASTAPFVGLFGTVLGIIRAFQSMSLVGGGLPGVSQGIAEALIVTAFGLFVAIPATWAYNFITQRLERTLHGARKFSGIFLESLANAGGASTRRLFLQNEETSSLAKRLSHATIRSEINVTPLVDVVLVLLIIFMVVTPPPQSVLDLGISQTVQREAAGSREPSQEQVLLRITAEKEFYVNDKQVNPQKLTEELRSTFRDKGNEPLFFEADPLVDYTEVVAALDQCSSAGIANIAIVSRSGATP